METILIEYNFVYDNVDDVWTKDVWTIRFRDNDLEAFTKFSRDGLYVKKSNSLENLKDILEYIKNT